MCASFNQKQRDDIMLVQKAILNIGLNSIIRIDMMDQNIKESR